MTHVGKDTCGKVVLLTLYHLAPSFVPLTTVKFCDNDTPSTMDTTEISNHQPVHHVDSSPFHLWAVMLDETHRKILVYERPTKEGRPTQILLPKLFVLNDNYHYTWKMTGI